MPAILMPKLSDSMEEGTIIRWLVADGDEVGVGDEVAEIESDKAVMTYEAEAAGGIVHAAAEGDAVAVGMVIGHVLAAGEAAPKSVAARSVVAATAGARAGAPAAVAVPAVAHSNGNGGAPSRRANASPVARRIADALGIELAHLRGTGPQGRIVKRDVEAAAAASLGPAVPPPAEHQATTAAPAAHTAAGAPAANGKGAVALHELTRIQTTIARRMSEAKATMPEFTLSVEVDMDAAVELREEFKALGDAAVPSYNDFVVRASALALRAHPRANGTYRDGRFELYERVNVGVAVAASDALLVPTVMDADRRSLGEIAADMRRLAAAAREGTLTAADLSSGTFSVSNLGMFGIGAFTAVLNPPQAAILAVGALERRPVVRGDELAIGHRMSMTLTCDHRILYGADAARFLADIRIALEQPLRLAL